MQLRRSERLTAARERDGDSCLWCGRAFTDLVRPTTDHLIPKVKGGPSWLENEVAACRRCNGARGHQGAVEWLEECERRGWAPDVDRLGTVLASLSAVIETRGGEPDLVSRRSSGDCGSGYRPARWPACRPRNAGSRR